MWLLNRQDVVQYGRHFLVLLEEGHFCNLTMAVWTPTETEICLKDTELKLSLSTAVKNRLFLYSPIVPRLEVRGAHCFGHMTS